jgi:hypothetical protein
MSQQEFQVAQSALKLLTDVPVVKRFLRQRPGPVETGKKGQPAPSIGDVESELARILQPAARGPVPPMGTPVETKLLKFSEWARGVEGKLRDSKTRRSFRKAKQELQGIVESLPEGSRPRFYSEFGTNLANMDTHLAAAYANPHTLVDGARSIAKGLATGSMSGPAQMDLLGMCSEPE